MKRKNAAEDEEFRIVWNRSDSVAEVACKTNINKRDCILMANRMRKAGFKLKKFAAGQYRTQKSPDPSPEEIRQATDKIKNEHLRYKRSLR